MDIFSNLFVFVLATLLGLEVIRRVSPLLHTPLMSLTNAISAISLVGALLVLGEQTGAHRSNLIVALATVAVFAAMTNVVSGFLITDRMLKMFKRREPQVPKAMAAMAVPFGLVATATLATTTPGGAPPAITQASYLLATGLFILSLKWLNTPVTARRGVVAGEIGMVAAVVGTLVEPAIQSYQWIVIGMLTGTVAGLPLALLMPMTAVPQRTALSHSFGGLAVGLIGTCEFILGMREGGLPSYRMGVLSFEVLLGFLTFTGSLMAFGKLQEILPTRPIVYKGQNVLNLSLLGIAVLIGIVLTARPVPQMIWLYPIFVALALAFGVLLIVPIGGADMPTVISLLNSYAGLSASAMGFVLENKMLIVAGALDGSSGLILSIIMCRAMNRSFTNVLFGAFGQVQTSAAVQEQRTVRSASPEEAAAILESASSVIVVPGYGMAVAQAQHKVRELFDTLTRKGVDVRFAIHPVAGRMPGHMNVLLAEADIPYDKLAEMDDINGDFPQTDVALVIGANDVTNPAARHDKSSPIYGMPILNVDQARTVMVIKRSMSSGFAGIDNELYFMDKTLMLFGDAKSFVTEIVKAASGSGH